MKTQESETILVVEDSDEVRFLVVETLKDEGYAVLEASGPREALSISEKHEGPIHLLLSDIMMPEMNGMEVAAILAPLRPQMKILFMFRPPSK